MNTQEYIGFNGGRRRRLKRRIIGIIITILIILAAAFVIGKLTEDSAEYQLRASLIEENRVLREQVAELTSRIDELEGTVSRQEEYIASIPTKAPEETEMPEEQTSAPESSFSRMTPRDSIQ